MRAVFAAVTAIVCHFFPFIKVFLVAVATCFLFWMMCHGRAPTWEILIKANVLDIERIEECHGIRPVLRRIHLLASMATGILFVTSLCCSILAVALPSSFLPIGVSALAIGSFYATLASCSFVSKVPMDTFLHHRLRQRKVL